MVFTKNRNRQEARQVGIGTNEAHSLWRLTVDRYVVIEHLNLLENYTHDKDFKAIVKKSINALLDDIKMLEENLNHYSISGHKPARPSRFAVGNTEVVNDYVTAQVLLSYYKADIITLIFTLRDSLVTDSLRKIFMDMTKNALNKFGSYVKYLKAKGWIEQPPLYSYLPPGVDEKVASNEIFLLWDHLVFRYSNIHTTKRFLLYAVDKDFKMLLKKGIKVLVKQANQIESKLIKFGVTLPFAYPNVIGTPESTENITDEYMFNNIFIGMRNAVTAHGAALIEVIVNDDIRNFFYSLTFEEMNILDSMIKYGKLKGWINVPPEFKHGKKQ